MSKKLEYGLQFVTHIANQYTLKDWISLAKLAHEHGFQKVWLNDNVRYRPPLVVLTAIAASVPIRLGTAVLVPYFHQPLDLADSLAALSELCEGREVSIGLARGDLGQTDQHVEVMRPLSMVKELAGFLRVVLEGQEASYADYPTLQEFYHLNPKGRFRLSFKPKAPFEFYSGGAGPKSLRIAGRFMDGVISSGAFISLVRAGRQADLLRFADEAAEGMGVGKRLRKMCELNVSISGNREEALQFPKRQVAHSALQWEALGFTEEEYSRLGLKREQVLKLKERFQAGDTIEDAASLVSDEMVQASYIVGRPEEAVEQILELDQVARDLGYDQIAFAKLGPDYEEAINLIGSRILPALR